MDIEDFQMLVKALPVLESREMLRDLTVQIHPYTKKEVQTKRINHLNKIAYPKIGEESEPRVMTRDLLLSKLKGAERGR